MRWGERYFYLQGEEVFVLGKWQKRDLFIPKIPAPISLLRTEDLSLSLRFLH
jgi:hypothetical protein